MISLVIADDHPLVREGIEKVLKRGNPDIQITAEVSNAEELLDHLATKIPDLVVLDIALPGKSGLDVLKDITRRYEDLPVLILSMHPEERFAVRALKAGAYGYLSKESVTEKLIQAIDQIVMEERKYISDAVAEQLADEVNGGGNNSLPHKRLSDREFQVMCMIASGKKVTEIAEELSLSARTIHTYRSRLMEKMDLGSNVAITRYALAHQLIEEP